MAVSLDGPPFGPFKDVEKMRTNREHNSSGTIFSDTFLWQMGWRELFGINSIGDAIHMSDYPAHLRVCDSTQSSCDGQCWA